MPLVQHSLVTPVCFNGVPGLGFPDQCFGLAPLHAPDEKASPERFDIAFDRLDPVRQRSGVAKSNSRLLEACQAVRQFAGEHACGNQSPAAPLSLHCRSQGFFKLNQFSHGGLERMLALFFFKLADAEKPEQGT